MGLWDPILSRPSPDISISYEFLEEIGHGASSVVRVCRHRASGEKFACKSILKDNLRCAADVADVRREIQVLEQLGHHAHVVQLHGTFEDISAVHLVMQLCHGGELFHEIVRRERFSESDAALVFRQLAEAVAFCHARGVLHRDLKPENILLLHPVAGEGEGEGGGEGEGAEGRGNAAVAAVADWQSAEQRGEEGNDGAASPLEQQWPSSSVTPPNPSPHHSQSGTPPGSLMRHSSLPSPSSSAFSTSPLHLLPTITDPVTSSPTPSSPSAAPSACPPPPSPPPPLLHVKLADFGLALHLGPGERAQGFAGSPFYVAPEVLARRSYNTSADMWSLGVVLYSLLAGDLPFVGDTEKKVFRAITKGRLNLQADPWPSVSAPAKALIRRLLDPSPASRLSAPQLLGDPWLAHTPLPPPPLLPVPRPEGEAQGGAAGEGDSGEVGTGEGEAGATGVNGDVIVRRASSVARPGTASARVPSLEVPDAWQQAQQQCAPHSPHTPSPRPSPPHVSASRSAAAAAASALRRAARQASSAVAGSASVAGSPAGGSFSVTISPAVGDGERHGRGEGRGEADGTPGGASAAAGGRKAGVGGSAGGTPSSAVRSLAAAFGRSPGSKAERGGATGGKAATGEKSSGQLGGVGSGTKRIVKALFRSLSSLASDYRRGRFSSLGLGSGAAGAEGEGAGRKSSEGAGGVDLSSASGKASSKGAEGRGWGGGSTKVKDCSSEGSVRVPGRASFSSSSSSSMWDSGTRGNSSQTNTISSSSNSSGTKLIWPSKARGVSSADGASSSGSGGNSKLSSQCQAKAVSSSTGGCSSSSTGGEGSTCTPSPAKPPLASLHGASDATSSRVASHAASHAAAHAASHSTSLAAHLSTDPSGSSSTSTNCSGSAADNAAAMSREAAERGVEAESSATQTDIGQTASVPTEEADPESGQPEAGESQAAASEAAAELAAPIHATESTAEPCEVLAGSRAVENGDDAVEGDVGSCGVSSGSGQGRDSEASAVDCTGAAASAAAAVPDAAASPDAAAAPASAAVPDAAAARPAEGAGEAKQRDKGEQPGDWGVGKEEEGGSVRDELVRQGEGRAEAGGREAEVAGNAAGGGGSEAGKRVQSACEEAEAGEMEAGEMEAYLSGVKAHSQMTTLDKAHAPNGITAAPTDAATTTAATAAAEVGPKGRRSLGDIERLSVQPVMQSALRATDPLQLPVGGVEADATVLPHPLPSPRPGLLMSPLRGLRRCRSSSSNRGGESSRREQGEGCSSSRGKVGWLRGEQGQENGEKTGGGGWEARGVDDGEHAVQVCSVPFQWRPLKGSVSGRLVSGSNAAHMAAQTNN